MTRIFSKVFGTYTGALAGYVIGWLLGWSAFDPKADLWAFCAFVFALSGLVAGFLLRDQFWQYTGRIIGGAIGIFLAWMVRTLLFGDSPGGPGLLLTLVGLAGGWIIGAKPPFHREGQPLNALAGALWIGFFGGFLVDWVLLRVLMKGQAPASNLWQAPGVLLAGCLGAWIGARTGRAPLQPENNAASDLS